MYKLILLFVFCIPTLVYAEDVHTTVNEITTIKQCREFEILSFEYLEKSNSNDLFSEKYKLISDNYMSMYIQCMDSIKKNKSYDGFRENIIQQQSISGPYNN